MEGATRICRYNKSDEHQGLARVTRFVNSENHREAKMLHLLQKMTSNNLDVPLSSIIGHKLKTRPVCHRHGDYLLNIFDSLIFVSMAPATL